MKQIYVLVEKERYEDTVLVGASESMDKLIELAETENTYRLKSDEDPYEVFYNTDPEGSTYGENSIKTYPDVSSSRSYLIYPTKTV
jgi:hypothetical protein